MTTRTKFILTYIGGIATGIVIVFVFGYCIAMSYINSDGTNDIEMYEEPTQTIDIRNFVVIQVLSDGSALASAEGLGNFGVIVLFNASEGDTYYDHQQIAIPSGKCLKQVGTYRYVSRQNENKTVPVVDVFDK